MKCQFCGTINQPDRDRCERCNKPLSSNVNNQMNMTMNENNDKPTNRQPERTFNPKATVRETEANTPVVKENPALCPNCGYELTDGTCAYCGYIVKKEQEVKTEEVSRVAVNVRKTMRPVRKTGKNHAFVLVPISEETGMPEGEMLNYEGEDVVLNRDNTDPKNETITSQEQAVVSFENGKWCIEDRSEYKTTFVQAARKMELQAGDLILLGTQLYRFEG